jgi:hypothetical protein
MTAMTAIDADHSTSTDYDGPVCQVCGKPCWQWKGSVHGYTCTACLEVLMDKAAARWDAKSAKARERVQRTLRHHNDNDIQNPVVTADGDRRPEGGQRYVPRPPASIPVPMSEPERTT